MAWNKGWDEIFRKHDWGRYPAEDLIRFVAGNFGTHSSKPNVRILEIGCGTGANIWYLAREGFAAYGIDGSRVALDLARERLREEEMKADLQLGEAMNLPYDAEFFDAVLDNECLYANTKADTRVIIKEIDRVLKYKGLFFSRTFATGTYGDGLGTCVAEESHTFSELREGAFKEGYGIIRFTAEEELSSLYAPLKIENVEYLIRSIDNGTHEIKEWLITGSKSRL